MVNSLVDEAVRKFSEGYSCSQAILTVYGKQFGIDEKTALRLARSFGGGMARTCQTCGAVTGAYIVLGLKNDCEDEKVAKERTYALVQDFAQRFKERHGDVNCQQLLGCDLGLPEGQDYFKNNKLIGKCRGLVKDASIILEELL
ncbi:C-GCAxxG-C-C family protein [Pelosinus sp. IPA-1]|uniref:C-GCAxxG-C-C family protein n=1 Tax=Pelosinus sp. IPA-1 TaxID=3029569 RepID=UPI0024362A3C|nr:C-GCAxxG-C-C family protein [Pelosinus sp. IPA-1]GMA98057.1 hypothetical protein PIPA1_08570 [Pelosinus sp. IPA-1]